jgi:hypothetical protein
MDYLKDLEIDENNLHEVIDRQAFLSMQYHELYADKLDESNEQKRKVQMSKTELEEIYSKLYLINKSSGTKITEKENESLIKTTKEYKDKQQKYFDEIKKLNDIDKGVNILEGVIKNMQQRKNMIEAKVSLYNLGFNSNIRQNKNDTENKNKNDTENKIKNKLNNRG